MEGPLLPLRWLFSLPMLHVLFKYDRVIREETLLEYISSCHSESARWWLGLVRQCVDFVILCVLGPVSYWDE